MKENAKTTPKTTTTKHYPSPIPRSAFVSELELLRNYCAQKDSVQKELTCGIIDYVDATNELQMISKKERKLIRELVDKVHVRKDGEKRGIKYQPSKGLYYTLLPNKDKIYGSTEDIVYEKLFVAYRLSFADYSFSGVFNKALDEKEQSENRAEDTIYQLRAAYNRFIDNSLATKDIRSITNADLKAYTKKMVNKIHPKEKAFKAYKGVLNLVFKYALEYNMIQSNPALAIKKIDYCEDFDSSSSQPEDKILTEEEIQTVKNTVRKYMTRKRYHGYFINGYAILLSIETGMRAGELPSLKWTDIKTNHIHIHSQQLSNTRKGGKEYFYAGWTKNEKRTERVGRRFPLTDTIKSILNELKELQTSLGIESEYIFCDESGEWIKTDAYETCLRRMLTSLGFSVTNNHAFRMSLNSNVLIKKLNLDVTERARLLGHSVQTNLKYYSFAGKDNIDELCAIFNDKSGEPQSSPDKIAPENTAQEQVSPRSHQNVIDFSKRKSSRTPYSQAF